ncbi:MAG TPA: hypothetical protein ENK99_03025 [Campylobacterales bacterium]|nr:hypothetical protein [Campylobacterales bacterium]
MITPAYDFSQDEVILYKGESQIVNDGICYDGIAEIKFVFLPKSQIIIDAKFEGSKAADFIDYDEGVTLFILENKVDIFIIESMIEPTPPIKSLLKCVPKINGIPILLDNTKKAKKVVSHIFNFYNFQDWNKKIDLDNGGFRISETTLETRNYDIVIQSMRETSKHIEMIKKDGKSRLTQVVKIEKKDGGFVSIEEYKKLQELLKYFFSFTKGSWITLTCATGLDYDNKQVWHLFNDPKSEWKSLSSWFDPTRELNMIALKKLFSLFSKIWESENWRETLAEVIYWFINANDGEGGVDTGLILAQTALERLSFEYVVNDKKLLSGKGFKDIWASDKFRLLFSSLSVPLGIPSELTTLAKEAKNHNWLDSPHALTEIRNSLVHPEHKKHGKFNIDVYIEAHTLSLWYLEVSILAICKYDGLYSNRVNRGDVENVPYLDVE